MQHSPHPSSLHPDLFISYAHVDQTVVYQLSRELKTIGYNVWLDSELGGSQDFVADILQAIEACKCLIVVLSPTALNSRYVKMELHHAVEKGRKVVPILLSPEVKLPPLIRTNQAVMGFLTDFVLGFKELRVALKALKVEPSAIKGVQFFDTDLDEVKALFGKSSNASIEEFVPFLASKFHPLFSLEPTPSRHPFFRDVVDFLDARMPEVSLDDEHGKLMRINVRHVLLRQETIQLLMGAIPPDQLEATGRSIGTSAASDLLNITLQHHYFPNSATAFVNLWSYWDRIGGMGRLQLLAARDDLERGRWEIQIDSNFLHKQDEAEHRLCRFWCGYIFGFLSTALRSLRDLMYLVEPDREAELALELPVFERVKAVQHIKGGGAGNDRFRVTFEPERYAQALRLLNEGHRRLEASDPVGAGNHCVAALKSARGIAGGIDADFAGTLAGCTPEELEIVRYILEVGQMPDTAKVIPWFQVVTHVIQQLTSVE